jgi:hypothetical protein
VACVYISFWAGYASFGASLNPERGVFCTRTIMPNAASNKTRVEKLQENSLD